MQSVRSRIWTRVAVSISYEDNHYTTGTLSDLIIVNKKEWTWRMVGFVVPANHRVKLKECEKRDKYLVLAVELKKPEEHESDDYTNCNWCSWYSHQRISKKTRRLGNHGTGRDCSNYSIVEIGQNTEKSPGDLRHSLSLKLQGKTIS